jgi:flavodoxin
MLSKTQWWIVGGLSALVVGIITIYVVKSRKKTNMNTKDSDTDNGTDKNVDKNKNYIIGDSQSPIIDRNSKKASLINKTGSEQSLWKGGMGLSWLKSAVENYKVSTDVNTIIINIGTNGKFNVKDDISGLVSSIKNKFPNAKLLAVKGSWGWDNNKNVTTSEVNRYYDIFKKYGVKVLGNAIGKTTNPHKNLPIYAKIGEEIDKNIT